MLRITFPSDWPDPLTSETLWLRSWPPSWRWLSASQEPQCIGLDSVSWPAEKFSYAETIIQFTLGNVTLRCKTHVQKEKIIFCKTKQKIKLKTLSFFYTALFFVNCCFVVVLWEMLFTACHPETPWLKLDFLKKLLIIIIILLLLLILGTFQNIESHLTRES